jgi:hypothetical protein
MNKSDRARLHAIQDKLIAASEDARELIMELELKACNLTDHFPVQADEVEEEAGVIDVAFIGVEASIEDIEGIL